MSLHLRGLEMVSLFRPVMTRWPISFDQLTTRAVAALVLCSSACQVGVAPEQPHASIDYDAVRAEIDRYACAAWLDEQQIYEARFTDSRCDTGTTRERVDVLAKAVRRAVEDCTMLVPLAAAAYASAYQELDARAGRSQVQLDHAVRRAYWKDDHLGPAVLARSVSYLAQLGVECANCPSRARASVKLMTWEEFKPHVEAYLWPSRDEQEVQIYLCSEINGIEELRLDDSAALEAGFLAAFALFEDEATHVSITELNQRGLDIVELRTEIAAFVGTPQAIAVMCRSLERSEWFTGVRVSACDENAALSSEE